ncbi:MAG TPA: SDR family oxidoreductase [Gemmatimonadales bacterium]|nr:SDR family oxidoreductase [Gemmatimonadales bacterium]
MTGPDRQPLKGLGVVVTGAGSGIGAATASLLASKGAALILVDRDADRLRTRAAAIASTGGRVSTIRCDVSRADDVARLCAESVERPGGIGAVIHCAGIVHPGALEATTPDWIARQVEVNLLGTIYVTRAFLPHFRARGGGHVIMLGSLGGIAPMPRETIYSATKFAVRGFGLALALELRGSPIRISVVCPDSVTTPQLRQEAEEGGSPVAFTARLLTPERIAETIAGALARPRREILVPRFRGSLIRLLNLVPDVYARAIPALERMGRRGRTRYLADMARDAERPIPR